MRIYIYCAVIEDGFYTTYTSYKYIPQNRPDFGYQHDQLFGLTIFLRRQ
jgi:hypothetical protein